MACACITSPNPATPDRLNQSIDKISNQDLPNNRQPANKAADYRAKTNPYTSAKPA